MTPSPLDHRLALLVVSEHSAPTRRDRALELHRHRTNAPDARAAE